MLEEEAERRAAAPDSRHRRSTWRSPRVRVFVPCDAVVPSDRRGFLRRPRVRRARLLVALAADSFERRAKPGRSASGASPGVTRGRQLQRQSGATFQAALAVRAQPRTATVGLTLAKKAPALIHSPKLDVRESVRYLLYVLTRNRALDATPDGARPARTSYDAHNPVPRLERRHRSGLQDPRESP